MLTVGQELYYVPADRRYLHQAKTVQVKKVGRKWAEVDAWLGRVNIETLFVDGGGYASPGRCWLDKEAWEAEERRRQAWAELREIANSYRVPDISEDAIRGVIRVLSANITQAMPEEK